MKRVKIGQGYLQSAYGRGVKKTPIIWLINGKAYAKDSRATPFQTDLDGYVMVNYANGFNSFSQVDSISDHLVFTEKTD